MLPPLKGEGDRVAVEGFSLDRAAGKVRRTPQSPSVTVPLSGEPLMLPPLKGEGDRAAVEGLSLDRVAPEGFIGGKSMGFKHYTGYNAELKGRSRQLRKNMTRQERHLWYDFLRDYPVKVYRQRSIDRFIVDFYCSRAHLVIELDGGQHYTSEGQAYDTERSAVLQNYNLAVIRVSNADVDQNFSGVCAFIDRRIKEELSRWED